MSKEEMQKELESLNENAPCQQCYEDLAAQEIKGKKRCMFFHSVGCDKNNCEFSHDPDGKLSEKQLQHVFNQMKRLRRKKYLIKCLSGDGGPGGKGKRSGSKGAGKGKGKKGQEIRWKIGCVRAISARPM